MSKATKKRSKIKFLGKHQEFIQEFNGLEAKVNVFHRMQDCREDFLKQLKQDGLNYLLNFKNIKTKKEVSITLEILKVLLQYDIMLSESELDENIKWSNEDRELKTEEVFKELYL